MTRRLIADGRPGDAYDTWDQAGLPPPREAFITKWFFASGLAISDARLLQPLVLDSNVWNSLRALGWSSQRASGFKYSTTPSAGYCAYLRGARVWADALTTARYPVTAEKVEIFLFNRNGKLDPACD
jgi:hypothetical protein